MMKEDNIKEKKTITRRHFLDFLIGGSIAATIFGLLVPILAYLRPKKRSGEVEGGRIKILKVSELPEGEGKLVLYQNKPVILIHTKSGFSALSAICTHLGCIVKWDAVKQQVLCPCHAGIFDIKGNVLSGPVPRPLPPYNVSVVAGDVYIEKG
ncbi:MAG: ubiquinol-cytochrome c reductase iron-sulfur subunit [Candidatus Aminicenantia bacterium]